MQIFSPLLPTMTDNVTVSQAYGTGHAPLLYAILSGMTQNYLQGHYARISAGAGLTQQPQRAAVAGFRRVEAVDVGLSMILDSERIEFFSWGEPA